MENGHTNWDFHLKPLLFRALERSSKRSYLAQLGYYTSLIVIVYFQCSQNTRETPSLKHSYFHILDCNCALIEVGVHDPHTTIYVEGCATPDVALTFHVAITVILSPKSTTWCFWKVPLYLNAFGYLKGTDMDACNQPNRRRAPCRKMQSTCLSTLSCLMVNAIFQFLFFPMKVSPRPWK